MQIHIWKYIYLYRSALKLAHAMLGGSDSVKNKGNLVWSNATTKLFLISLMEITLFKDFKEMLTTVTNQGKVTTVTNQGQKARESFPKWCF